MLREKKFTYKKINGPLIFPPLPKESKLPSIMEKKNLINMTADHNMCELFGL